MKLNVDGLQIYRKRFIPEECILLKDDLILACQEDFMITKWNTINPRKDLHHGFSCYLFEEGIKVSKFLKEDNSLLYWYCDIMDYTYKKDTNELVSTDLLADVVIRPDGSVRVVDLDELATALREQLVDKELIARCLERLNALLSHIYDGSFQRYIDLINAHA